GPAVLVLRRDPLPRPGAVHGLVDVDRAEIDDVRIRGVGNDPVVVVALVVAGRAHRRIHGTFLPGVAGVGRNEDPRLGPVRVGVVDEGNVHDRRARAGDAEAAVVEILVGRAEDL